MNFRTPLAIYRLHHLEVSPGPQQALRGAGAGTGTIATGTKEATMAVAGA